MDLIPAIDIIGGSCVRLSQGDYARKTEYGSDPLAIARQFEEIGIRRLHLVDLEGAKAGRLVNLPTLEKIASKTGLTVDFGGGIRDTRSLEQAFDAGASMVTCGSVAVKDPDLVGQWMQRFGKEHLILGADAKDGMIATSGWTESSRWEVGPFVDRFLAMGFEQVICTDIACDGMLAGPSIPLYRTLQEGRPGLRLVASGGISCIDDLRQLREAGLYGAIVGKAFYEGRITLESLRAFEEEQHVG
jgi:phosphoribosylformimino-5-aminoimidazole carboxamide ribotide isomerase